MGINAKIREQIKNKFSGRCAYCGSVLGDKWHVDHFIPVLRCVDVYTGKQTGEMEAKENDNVENYMPSCAPCNIDKGRRPIEDWRKKLENSINVLQKNSTTYRHAIRYGMIKETPCKIVFFFERQ